MSPDRTRIPRIIVVGGGVAGLATAFLLREIGGEAGRGAEVIVLESLNEAGGSTRTDHVDGYTCEWGPNGFLDNEPATLQLVERLGLTPRLVKANENAGHRFIYHGGKMREVPVKPPAFLMSNIVPFSAKLRMGMELFVPAKRNGAEETVHSFGKRRLGRVFADYLLDPMVSGIFAGDTKELSLPAVFPKMVEMEREYGGLFRALIAKQKEAKRDGTKSGGPAGASAVLTTFVNGMGELTTTLADRLPSMIQSSSAVRSVERKGSGFAVRLNNGMFEADAVVLACPSYATADIIASLAPHQADVIRQIPYAPVDVVCHGHSRSDFPNDLNGFGVLIPRSEGLRSLGCLWCDSIFPSQAPADRHLLRTMIGGAHDTDVVNLSADELEDLARRDNAQLLKVSAPPVFRKVFRHAKGIAQYTLGHLERVATTEKLEDEMPGLYFTGASYRGVSVNGCAKDAFRVARRFWQQWGERA
jgi:protoporphyrinogen/coproporphyrinogen III oxidase